MMKQLLIVLFCLLLSSCGPRSLQDYKDKGGGVVRSIITELQEVRTRQDLVASSRRIDELFNELADVMIAAHEFSRKEGAADEINEFDRELSDQFRVELSRVYKIEGARAILEKSQEKALQRLDTYHRSL